MADTHHSLATGARSIGIIAAAGMIDQTLTHAEFTGLVRAALLGLDEWTGQIGMSPETEQSLRQKLATLYCAQFSEESA